VAAFIKYKPRNGLFLEPQAKNGIIIRENCGIRRESIISFFFFLAGDGKRVGQPKSCFGTNQGNNQFYSLFKQKLLIRPSLWSGSTTELRQSLK
jgi:hypothetical protein